MKTLNGTSVPVPHCYCLCIDESVIGTTFFVMKFIKGRVFSDPSLPTLSPHERTSIYHHMISILAALHC